jgi:phenylacetate-CoA ligase
MSALKTFLLWRRFERQQWLSPQRLEELQHRRLRVMMHWAYQTVPYYRELFKDAGLKPEQIRTAGNLGLLPALTKQHVRAHADALHSVAIPKHKLTVAATTGSTGIPLAIAHDQISVAAGRAVMLRAFRAHGMRLTDSTLRITHRRRKQALHELIGILPVRTASVHAPSRQLASIAATLRPDILDSYPSVLLAMSKYGELLPDSVRRIFSTTEMLTDQTRKRLDRAFGAPVIDLYGAVEFPRLAWECPAGGGYHVDADYALTECTESGELLVTGLYNYGMPLIRYAIGDLAQESDGPCACGRGLPLLKSIEGRTDDSLTMPGGDIVSPRRVNVLDGITGIAEYRIVQTKRDRVVAEIVPADSWTPGLERAVIARIQRGLEPYQVDIQAKQVDSIKRGRGGKLRTVISRVSS